MSQVPVAFGRPSSDEAPTTDGLIALINLESQIDSQEAEASRGVATVESQVALTELITLRGLILGRISDFERAEECAERLLRNEAANASAFFARARTRATFHRFTDALADLEAAERLSPNFDGLKSERAAVLQALGRYDEALVIRREAASRRPSFETLAALAGLCAEQGEIETAEALFLDSQSRYRGVSPFPLALVNFQCGLMRMTHGQLEDARTSFDAAQRRVPAYAPAQGHLAEVEAELGDIETAIDRLFPLAWSSEDPDYAAQLARILVEVGRSEESREWSQRAGMVYDELVARHPEAFADHAAEFWLEVGADPKKALPLAQLNFGNRKTPRALDLLSRAASASQAAGSLPC
jgi:tetratricopeptide (TPR) repeat protein